MYNLNRILVCLDMSEVDNQLIRAASSLATHVGAQNFYFLHVVESLELPHDLEEKYPDLIAPVDENVKLLLKEKIDKNFKNISEVDYEIDVIEGNITDKILRWSRVKEADLIIMGKKIREKGSGMHAEKIVKVCHCSFLLVPDNSHHKLNRIMVSIDFSEKSRMALEQAILISEKSGASVTCHHVYKVPVGYHSTGKSYAEFTEIMRTNSIKSYNSFLRGMGLKTDRFQCIYKLMKDSDIAKVIHKTAVKEKIDLIIMASKGRTGLASILLGSVAMKTVKYDLEIELLVVKNKKENMGFLEALINV